MLHPEVNLKYYLKKNYRARRRTYGVHLIQVIGNGIRKWYNVYHNYSMNGENLQAVSEETDLGIIISSDLKPSKQCICAVKKANMHMTLGMIKRHIVSRDKKSYLTGFTKV